MNNVPLSLSKKHVLGSLYSRCEELSGDIPVYMFGENGERLGHVNESLGHYADAFTFHLSESVCKDLAGGQFTYEFDVQTAGTGRMLRLAVIYLKPRANGPDASQVPPSDPKTASTTKVI
jgi:hypothetical protein